MNALALIIGNANYVAPKDRLINSVNDAEDFGRKLLNLGFSVEIAIDCNRERFDQEVRDFGEKLSKYEVGLFYFAGHGLQIEGKNYLTAIDTNFADAPSVKFTSFPLDAVIEYMQIANPTIKILILDACRDNPLPNHYRSGQINGLAPIYAPKGTIIAFSTSPGEKALDYGSGRNSIYTGALLNHIDDTNVPVEDFFKRVRTTVFSSSNGRQTSWEHTSLIGNFYFNSEQLIHSIDLPYNSEYIADKGFLPTSTPIDSIIKDLKSHTFYTQKNAIDKLKQIPVNTISEDSMFLLGRNILQTAIGGEFTAISIIKNLDNWLRKYSLAETNHVLNGILFEIYFNSKGQFRQRDFKCGLIDEIFKLETNDFYKSSFELIVNQLLPFRAFLYYLPINPPTTIAIEIQVEKFEYRVLDKIRIGYNLISVKHENIELLEPNIDENYMIPIDYEWFLTKLRQELCVPKNRLRLSINVETTELKTLQIPWLFKLSRQKNK